MSAAICSEKLASPLSQAQLNARAKIAADLFREGRITRCETFRLEVDAVVGIDHGPIKYEKNTDFEEGIM